MVRKFLEIDVILKTKAEKRYFLKKAPLQNVRKDSK